jgi:predicted dehydrogenase
MPDSCRIVNESVKVLLIGYSRIARKRIIPALAATGRVSCLDIASRHSAHIAKQERLLPGICFDSYEKALAESRADIVYISLVNSDHAAWAEKSLLSGRHVIIDKPAVTRYSDAARLVDCARQHGRALFEATVFSCHPQIDAIREEFTSRNLTPTRVTALFSFPPLPADDFRYSRKMGGGAINDLGPYAISAGTVFFNEHPDAIFCHINNRAPNGVETSFSITAAYSTGRAMVGHFGFDTEYQNMISVLGTDLCVRCERVFTIPVDHENMLDIRHNNKNSTRSIPPGDCFLIFFNQVFDACAQGNFATGNERFLADARSLDLLKQSAHKENQL